MSVEDIVTRICTYIDSVAILPVGDKEILLGLVVAIDTNTIDQYCEENSITVFKKSDITYDFVNLVRLFDELLLSGPDNINHQTLCDIDNYSYLYNPKVLDKKVIEDFKEWNFNTYGPGERLTGTIEHIKEELTEIEKEPHDIVEWIDVVMLAMNGALRHGHEPQDIINAFHAKLEKNKKRKWQDYTTVPEGTPIKHIKEDDSEV